MLQEIIQNHQDQGTGSDPCRVCAAGDLESSVLDFVLGLLWQGGDLSGWWWRPLAGVEAVKRWEEAEPVGGAHGLLQVTHLVHQFLDGVVAFHGAALYHLHGGDRGRQGEGAA